MSGCKNHLSTIRKKTSDVVPLHFCSSEHTIEDFRIVGLEKIYKSWIYRKEKEKFWMHKIGTLDENGLNRKA